MSDIRVGDRVRFNADARRRKFFGGTADGRKRMTVDHVFPNGDISLTNGEIWHRVWLELVQERSSAAPEKENQ